VPKITVDSETAKIEDGEWASSDPVLLIECEFFTLLHPWNPVPSNPDPDYEVAAYVAKELAGTITHFDKPEYVDGRVY
jgi:hypothetical protein